MAAISASRGQDIRNYIPALKKGAVIPISCLSAGFITGITAGAITSTYIGAGAVTSAKIGTAAVTNAKMKAAFLSGAIVSGRIVVAVAHGLAVKPKSVIVCPILTGAQGASAVAITVSVAAASAATSSNIYLIGSQKTNGAIKYAAYVQI